MKQPFRCPSGSGSAGESLDGTSGLPACIVEAKTAAEAGRVQEALDLLDDADIEERIGRDSSRTDVIFAVAGIFHQTRQLDKAEYCYRRILDGGPDALAYMNLGHICHFSGRLSEAVEYRKKAIEICPSEGSLYHDLGCSLIFVGQKSEGIEMLRKAVEMAPNDPSVHSTLLFRLHHVPELDSAMLFEEHKRWANVHAPTSLARRAHANDPDPDRTIRIGYISPDFRTHPVAYFFESLLDGHDRDAVEIYGYGNVACPDYTTERLRSKFTRYRSVFGRDCDEVVHLIERDRVDILVDLAGHTSGNRLGVLARGPAPIQVTYLGYPDTTGMRQIDYCLTDSLSTPPELQAFYTEELVFLPDGFLCYRPVDFAPPVASLPARIKGHITFGSFNNGCKLNSNTMSLWAQILSANAGSRMLLKSRAGDDAGVREGYFRQFEQQGISRDRVDIRGQKPAIEYLRLFDEVDIALDTFPYNGTTTTCDAMWMGVPVISLVGEHHASRVGLSVLTQVGLEFFAASEPNEYVRKATALAQNLDALAQIRASMRPRMTASPLCRAELFARAAEAAYRKMWRKWCFTHSHEVPGLIQP